MSAAIVATTEPLPAQLEQDFRSWLFKPERQTLVRIIEGQAKLHYARATGKASESDHGRSPAPLKLDAANDELRFAQRYDTFLEILKEIVDQPETDRFQTVKLT